MDVFNVNINVKLNVLIVNLENVFNVKKNLYYLNQKKNVNLYNLVNLKMDYIMRTILIVVLIYVEMVL